MSTKLGFNLPQAQRHFASTLANRDACVAFIKSQKWEDMDEFRDCLGRLKVDLETYIDSIGKSPAEGTPVELDMSEAAASENARLINHALDECEKSCQKKNFLEVGFDFGWLDSRITDVADALPEDVKNPPEPEKEDNPALRGGGGDKP